VPRSARTAQLQIRVSPAQKAEIRRRARRAGLGMSAWVLRRLLPPAAATFEELASGLAGADTPAPVLAELNDLLTGLGAEELAEAVSEPPRARLEPYRANYLAAMVELACERAGVRAPAWTGSVHPLGQPVFGASLDSLRLHLLTHAPPPFRRRNIFIDASIGDRV
jgi:hypothetical protein